MMGSNAYTIEQPNLVIGSSLIYNENYTLCYNLNKFDPSTEYLSEEISKRVYRKQSSLPGQIELAFTNKPRPAMKIDGTTVPFNLSHPYNYFHFLIEALPTLLWLVRSKLITPNDTIISGILHINMISALKFITENKFQIAELHLLNSVNSNRTIVAKDSFSANELISGEMVKNFEYNLDNIVALREYFEQSIRTPNHSNKLKLFIVRRSGQRNINNMKELIDTAHSHGYIALEPEKLSFTEQVELFRSASIVVGPTGAWLANLLFMRNDAKVNVLYPGTCRTEMSIWKKLGGFFGIEVLDHYFDDIILNQYQPIHSNFSVNIEVFSHLLNE